MTSFKLRILFPLDSIIGSKQKTLTCFHNNSYTVCSRKVPPLILVFERR
jgi:hypothetical protein